MDGNSVEEDEFNLKSQLRVIIYYLNKEVYILLEGRNCQINGKAIQRDHFIRFMY
jgi:hypothetical protein